MCRYLICLKLIVAFFILVPSHVFAVISPITHDIIMGDYNGDNKQDIFARSFNSTNVNAVILGDGYNEYNIQTQTFSDGHLGFDWSNSSNVFSGDFNNDGRDDVFIQSSSGNNNAVILSDGEGHLSSVQTTWANNYLGIDWAANNYNSILGRFDSNNATDVILQGKTSSSTHKLITNQGTGLDTIVSQWASDYLGLEWSAQTHVIHAGDFNGDGRSDLFLQARYKYFLLTVDDIFIPIPQEPDTGYSILLSNPDGTFTSVHQSWANNALGINWLENKHKAVIGDFNGDGRSDIFLQAASATGTHYILQADVNGKFTAVSQSFENGHLGLNWSTKEAEIDVADVNNDGKYDIINRSKLSSNTIVISADVNGTFSVNSVVTNQVDNSIDLTRVERGTGTEKFGSLNGSFSVTPGGTARYSVPIKLPPGMSGMAPKLALSYISQSTNGLLGVGWSLSGLSNVTRCGQNYAQDQNILAIELNDNDRLCLDGQRLILVSGIYGKNGATYRTQKDSFTLVIGSGDYNTSTSFFVAKTKDGKILNYGSTNDSKKLSTANSNIPKSWAVNKVADTVGNFFTVEYDHISPAEVAYPKRIEYTKNNSTSLNTLHAVDFIYEGRPDVSSGYSLGDLSQITKRLATIEILWSNTLIKKYQLTYEVSGTTKRSRIKNIQLCNAASECVPATNFDWSDRTLYTSEIQNTNLCADGDSSTDGNCNGSDNYANIYYPDINGDGFAELCFRADEGIRCYKGTSTGIDTTPFITSTICNNASNCQYSSIQFRDFNADGKDDLAYLEDNGLHILKSNGTGFNQDLNTGICASNPRDQSCYKASTGSENYSSTINYTDINGDKLLDICYVTNDGIRCSLYNGTSYISTAGLTTNICADGSTYYGQCASSQNRSSIRYLDFNADGLSDIVYRGDNGIQVMLSNGTSFPTHISTDICANGSLKYGVCNDDDNHNYIRYADVTGDGRVDICYRSDQGIYCHANTGKSFSTTDVIRTNICNNSGSNDCSNDSNYKHISYVDFNNDGKADLTYRGTNGIHRWLSTGSGFVEKSTISQCSDIDTTCDKGTMSYQDINGDGIADFTYRHGIKGLVISLSTGDKADLITSVTDELKNTTNINYLLLTNPTVYTQATDCSYPVICVQAAIPVVESYSVSNGVGGEASYRYTYSDLRIHVLGRGALGFKTTTHLDKQSNILTTINSNTTGSGSFTVAGTDQVVSPAYYPTLGMPDNSKSEYIGGGTAVLLEQTENTLAYLPTVGSAYFSYVSESTQTKFQFPSGSPLLKVTNSTFYEGVDNVRAGNISKLVQTTTDLATSSGTYTTVETNNIYAQDDLNSDKWYLGRLTNATVKHTTNMLGANGTLVPSMTRTTSFGYDLATGLLSWSIENENDVNLYKKTSYTYDGYGNKAKIKVEGNAAATFPVAARTTTTTLEDTSYASANLPIIMSNALQQASSKTIDVRYGVKTAVTGPNGLTTNWVLNGFGQVVEEIRADGNTSTSIIEFCSNATLCPAVSGIQPAYYSHTETDGSGSVTTYYDQLGRTLRVSSLNLNSDIIYADTVYNDKGQVIKKSNKYFAGTGDPVYWTSIAYDDIGRVVSETTANNRVSSISYAGFTTTSTITQVSGLSAQEQTALGVSQSRDLVSIKTKNINGKLKSTIDANGGKVSYFYDALGHLVETHAPGETNASAAVKTKITYNAAGQKTYMDDPDMGEWYYYHDIYGNLRKQVNAKNEATVMVYDDLNRMTARIESEGANRWIYDNAIDATNRGASTGKLVTMAGPIELSPELYNQYITSPPAAEQILISGAELHKRDFYYNSLGLAVNVKTTIKDGLNPDNSAKILHFEVDRSYDAFNRVKTITYPQNAAGDRLIVEHVYNNYNGTLLQIRNAVPDGLGVNHVFWKLGDNVGDTTLAVNANGQVQYETFGNGLSSIRIHKDSDGTIQSITTGGLSTVQNLNYVFDNLGNLERRSDENQSFIGRPLHERFKYDNLGRLTDVSLNDISYQRFEYDASGNMTYNSGFGYYQYDRSATGRAHAVTNVTSDAAGINSVISSPYEYDANGNQFVGADRGMSYTSFNKPHQIVKTDGGSAKIYSFNYAADHRRYKQNTPNKNIYYLRPGSNIGAHFERETTPVPDVNNEVQPDDVKDTHYIYAGNVLVATYIAKSTNEKYAQYHHRDHLGSVDVITDSAGFDIVRMSYAPFGERRNFDWSLPSANTFISVVETNYGFTGHEHIDDVGLIHMNGRVYDPKLARFVSADPHIQAPENSQSFNRYSYVVNNPLSYTDPSGYFWGSVKAFVDNTVDSIKDAVDNTLSSINDAVDNTLSSINDAAAPILNDISVVLTKATPYIKTAIAIYISVQTAGTSNAFMGGFISGMITGGDIKSGLIGGLTAGAFNAIGGSSLVGGEKVFAHGLVGGVSNTLRGGKFETGFLAAAVTQSVSKDISGIKVREARIFASAIVGGTVAEIGGGKFANGAVTAMFSRMFNDENHLDVDEIESGYSACPAGPCMDKELSAIPFGEKTLAYGGSIGVQVDKYPLGETGKNIGEMYDTITGGGLIGNGKVLIKPDVLSVGSKFLQYSDRSETQSVPYYREYQLHNVTTIRKYPRENFSKIINSVQDRIVRDHIIR